MHYVDLSHPFKDGMPVYPGDPLPRLEQVSNVEKDGYTDHKITSCLHVGTHIDAPWHMIEGGKKMTDIPVETFFGRGRLVDARGGEQIDADMLPTDIKKGDILLVLTGYSGKYGTDAYSGSHPVLTEAFGREAVRREVKMVGLDFLSPDKPPFPVHKILLSNDVLIIENLTGLERLVGVEFDVTALPMNMDADAGFARVVAMVK